MQQLERDQYESAVGAAELALGTDAFAVAWEGGRALDVEQSVAEASLVAVR
jgi:hypothetical protein